MNIELTEIIKVFNNLADKLQHREFPISQIPVQSVMELLMGIYENPAWVYAKINTLMRFMDLEDYTGCVLFFHDVIYMADTAISSLVSRNAYNGFRDKMLRDYSNNKHFHGKGVVYTVLTGRYKPLNEPAYVDPQFDYICFTDDTELKSEIWSIKILLDNENLGAQRLSRRPKILVDHYLGQYDYSIYVDSQLTIRGNLREYINKYSMGAPMLCFPHSGRNCVYEEAQACIDLKRDSESVIRKQAARYREEGMPEHYGLIEAGCLVRAHHNPEVINSMNDWWQEFSNGSCRDQISFPYVCWKNNFRYDISDLFVGNNEYIGFGG